MAPRITEQQIEAVLAMVGSGCSQQRIADIVVVSRGSVRRIAKLKGQPRVQRPLKVPSGKGIARWCRKCGATVKGECVACYIRNLGKG